MSSDSAGCHPVTDWRYWVPRLAVALVAPLLLFAGAEWALHRAEIGFDTQLLTPCTIEGKPGSCYNVFFLAQYFPPGIIKLPQVYGIPAQKTRNTYRIFVLGESAAMGDPDPAFAFSRYLEVMLQRRFPNVNFEVVNTGSVAINSHVALSIAEGVASQQPDLFILYSGNNEVVGPYGPGTSLTDAEMSLPLIRADVYVRSTHIGQFLTRTAARRRQWTGMEMFLDKQITADSPALQLAYRNYATNLRDTIRAARKAGAHVLVSTVVTNLADCAPFGSQHRPGLTPAELQSWLTFVQRGAALEDASNFAGALEQYRKAEAVDGLHAEMEFRIALCLTRLGLATEAVPHYLRARDLDALRFRADSHINELNRSAATLGSDVDVVDAEAALAAASPRGVVGNEMVYEHVHLTPLGNFLLARAMLEKVSKQVAVRFTQTDGAAQAMLSEEECERLLALTSFDRYRLTTEMAHRLDAAPFTNQLNHKAQVLYWLSRTAPPEETPQATAAQYQWAIAQRPADRLLHFNFGVFLLNFDQQAAYDQMRRSRPFDGFPVTSPDGTLQ